MFQTIKHKCHIYNNNHDSEPHIGCVCNVHDETL